uniref:ABC transporter transmembrane domain-containing protein n=1 Tax=Ruminococcus sp. TaxID=41978 RepID=UPI0038666748
MFKLLFKNMKAKNWVSVIAIFLLTLGEVFFMMQIVSYISLLTGAVQNSRQNGVAEIWWYGLYMVICAIMMAAIEVIIRFVASAAASSTVTGIRQKMYERVNEFAISDFASFSTESLITRTTNDMQNVHLAWLTFLKTAFLAPVVMVWSVILLLQYANTSLTLVTAIWLVLLVVVVVILLMMLTPKYKIIQKLTDALNVASRENLTGVRVVRAFNAETYQENKFEKVNAAFTKVQIFAGRVLSFFTPFVMMVMTGLSLSILWASAFVLNGMDMEAAAQSFSATNAFVMLASQIIMSFVLMVTLIVIWPRASVSAKRIHEVITHEVSVLDPTNPVSFKEAGTIEFKNVGFAYPGSDKEAVSDISFKVKKGETIAFIGATGSGKTT